ncbi:hypothetical protein H9X57_03270 [Flavobacterium piscinae]|nr:hypothetical protein [Flavobacterium piscinae]MBC8882757.1 hypothetical protein [Flavobacterium piscinae]
MLATKYDLKTKKTITTDLTDLFGKISASTGIDDENLNIEGAVNYKNNWLLFQRGNGSANQNGIVILKESLENPSTITFVPLILPTEKAVNVTFTDAILVEGKIYFLVAPKILNLRLKMERYWAVG